MSSAAQLTPPPGMDQSGPPPAPTSPTAASPSPSQPSPGMNAGTQDAIAVVSKLRGIAKAYPKAAPIVAKINDLMRQVMAAMMTEGTPGEPQAPPSAG